MAWEHGNHARGGLGKGGASFFYVKSFLGDHIFGGWFLFFCVCVCGGGGGFFFFRTMDYYIFFFVFFLSCRLPFVFTDAFLSSLTPPLHKIWWYKDGRGRGGESIYKKKRKVKV